MVCTCVILLYSSKYFTLLLLAGVGGRNQVGNRSHKPLLERTSPARLSTAPLYPHPPTITPMKSSFRIHSIKTESDLLLLLLGRRLSDKVNTQHKFKPTVVPAANSLFTPCTNTRSTHMNPVPTDHTATVFKTLYVCDL